MPLSPSYLTEFLQLIAVRDTFSSTHHSKDFIFARSEYLRSRIMVMGIIFLILMPFWTLMDRFLLPEHSLHTILIARAVMFVGLLGAIFTARKRWPSARLNLLLSGAVLILPALFYGYVLLVSGSSTLIGYSFIPFLLVALLGVFPFTLIESAMLGGFLLVLQLFAGHVEGHAFSAQALQNLWLLAALLVIAMTTNHFHLSLLLRLYRQATHDSLTNTLNRAALSRLTQRIEAALPRPSTAVILIDLDHFKQINDTHGHSTGDEVLRRFAAMLKEHVDASSICRYGGEEFLVVASPSTQESALRLAEQLRQASEQLELYNFEHQRIHLTISIGVSMLRDGENIETALQRADLRLYRAKFLGRNQVVHEDAPADLEVSEEVLL